MPLQRASIGSRGLAYLIDLLIRLLISFGIFLVLIVLDNGAEQLSLSQPTVGFEHYFLPLLVFMSYHLIVESLMQGETPGKKVVGICVVDASTGKPASFSQHFLRNLGRLIDCIPLYSVACYSCLFWGEARQRLGDKLAGTCLIFTDE